MNAGYKNPMITPVVLFGLFTLLAACSEMRPPAPQATESELTAQGVYPPYLTRYTLGERDANKKTLLNKERGFAG